MFGKNEKFNLKEHSERTEVQAPKERMLTEEFISGVEEGQTIEGNYYGDYRGEVAEIVNIDGKELGLNSSVTIKIGDKTISLTGEQFGREFLDLSKMSQLDSDEIASINTLSDLESL